MTKINKYIGFYVPTGPAIFGSYRLRYRKPQRTTLTRKLGYFLGFKNIMHCYNW